MRQGGSLSKCDNRFKCRPRCASLSHVIFDLGSYLKFSYPGFQQTDGGLHHLTRQNGRPSHLREFCRVLAHPEALHPARSRDPVHASASRFAKALQLPHRNLGGIKPHPAGSRILKELADGIKQRALLLVKADSGRLGTALHHESAIRNECSPLPRYSERAGLPSEAGQVIPVGRFGYQQRIDFRLSKI